MALWSPPFATHSAHLHTGTPFSHASCVLFWVRGGGLGGWSVGPIVVLGPAEGSCFLYVGGFVHSVE